MGGIIITEVDAGELGAGEAGVGEVRVCEVGFGEFCSSPADAADEIKDPVALIISDSFSFEFCGLSSGKILNLVINR